MKVLLVKALEKTFDMAKEDAISIAKTIEDVFHGENEIEDMDIDKHVRSLFYELHKENLLKVRREELKEKSKIIRKFYWSFDNDTIKEKAYRKAPLPEAPYLIYQKIPRNAWLLHLKNT